MSASRFHWTQRGFSLNEAMIALSVLTSGLLLLAQLQGLAQQGQRATRAQTDGTHLVRQKIEELRQLAATDFAAILDGADTPRVDQAVVSGLRRVWVVTAHPELGYKEVEVTAEWAAEDGGIESHRMTSLISPGAPYAPAAAAPRPLVEEAATPLEPGLERASPRSTDAAVEDAGAAAVQTREPPVGASRSAACLCTAAGPGRPVALQGRDRHVLCSDACCQSSWSAGASALCSGASCTYVARCGSG